MASIRTLKRRIKTSKNISQITRAMEMVSASKMKKAQHIATMGRLYSEELAKVLDRLAKRVNPENHPLLQKQNQGHSCVVVLSTDKGLCGGLNTNVFSQVEKMIKKLELKKEEFISVGRKSRDYLAKTKRELLASYIDLGDYPDSTDVRPLAKNIIQLYSGKKVSEVWIVYPKFISTLAQEPHYEKLLPLGTLDLVDDEQYNAQADYLFEPNADSILQELLPYYIENRLYQLILETKASEQSARMVSMKNAHDNAKDLAQDLTLTYNRLRQAKVTNELLDAVSSGMALE